MEKKYEIIGWKGNKYTLTAKELNDKIMNEKRSDYGWIATATELVRVCNISGFPQEYSKNIKLAILNYYANTETIFDESHTEPTDDNAVHDCYNSLKETEEEIVLVKNKYLKAIIKRVRQESLSFFIHTGRAFQKINNKWEKEKFEEFSQKEEVDFPILLKDLKEDYDNLIEKAEEEGIFTTEAEKIEEAIKKVFVSC